MSSTHRDARPTDEGVRSSAQHSSREPERRRRNEGEEEDRYARRSDRRGEESSRSHRREREEEGRGEKRRERSRSRSPSHKRSSHRRSRSRSRSRERGQGSSRPHTSSRRRSRSRSHDSRSASSEPESSASEDSESRARRKRKEKERKARHRERKERRRRREDSEESVDETREERRERKRRKKEKKKAKAGKGAIMEYGKHGIIAESDITSRLTAEFRQWLVEERHINPETISRSAERKEMATFIEDFNTATFPNDKYYNLEAHERRMAMIRAGETLPVEGAYDPAADEAAVNAGFRAARREREAKKAGSGEAWQSKEQLEELRRVQNERIEAAKMKQLGLEVSSRMGMRMDGTKFDR